MLKKFSLILIGIALLSYTGWYVYDFWWETRDWDYGLDEAKSDLVKNYKDNEAEFQELAELCKQIKTLGQYEIWENDQISFHVDDTTFYDPDLSNASENHAWYSQVGKVEENYIQDLEFGDSGVINVLANGEWIVQKNWWLSFHGDKNHNMIPKLLAYNNIDPLLAYELDKKMLALNCNGIDIRDSVAEVVFRGFFRSGHLCYIIPFNSQTKEKGWHRIAKDFYWEAGGGGSCSLPNWTR
ncbi:MAG: hypothetical protein ACI8ZM_001730 [Crocinitomix sp.]|jgi:hypothetical protein